MNKRVLIVDDEWRTLQGEAQRVKDTGLALEVVGLARNGLEALNQCSLCSPDIILCDIRMPMMDGIDFTIKAKDILPDVSIIYISGYSEKRYLKAAIRIGAVDYLFKPVDDEEFKNALIRAIQRHEETMDKQDVAFLDQDQLRLLLSQEHPEKLLDTIPNLMQNGEYAILIAKPYAQPPTEAAKQQLHMFALHMMAVLAEDKRLACVTWIHEQEAVVLVQNTQPSFSVPLTETLRQQCEDMIVRFPEAKTSWSVGVSDAFVQLLNARDAYASAQNALRLAFFRGPGRCYVPGSENGKTYETAESTLAEIKKAIDQRELHRAQELIDYQFQHYLRNERTQVANIRRIAASLMSYVETAGRVVSGAAQDGLLQRKMERQVEEGQYSLSMMKDAIDAKLKQLADIIVATDRAGSVSYRAKQYIWDHIGSQIPLKDIAAHVYLSPTYLCVVFKEDVGLTISQYIQQARIEKAKQLLAETDCTVKEIAHLVGYRNERFFSKVFSSVAQMNPTAYRKQSRYAC